MLGILVVTVISWLLLYLIEKKNILALGFLPILKRLRQFTIGFMIAAILLILKVKYIVTADPSLEPVAK